MARGKYKYYHELNNRLIGFLIPKNKTVLSYGILRDEVVQEIKSKKVISVFVSGDDYRESKLKSKDKFLVKKYEEYKPKGKFDYIVLNGTIGKTDDLMMLLSNVQKVCHPSTRLIIYQHNYLWQWVLNLTERYNLKSHEGVHNWLSIADIKSYLLASGFETTRIYKRTMMPISLFGIGNIINNFFVLIPFFDFLKLDQYLIVRPRPELFSEKKPESLTICLTVRNERDNIEPIVKSLPVITKKQEILFVEGHSSDGTKEEIVRVAKKYPKKNVRVIGQPGKGQGDAIRVGFKDAKGEIVILYEGDQTSEPGDIKYFYDALREGRFEFIEGSRFVYPLSTEAMPLTKKIGNMLFAKWFSFFYWPAEYGCIVWN